MKLIEFNSPEAGRIYEDYIRRCKKQVAVLPQGDQDDCLQEINSHIYESMQVEASGNEVTHLLNVLERIGPPEETLREMVAEKKIEQAIKTFNLQHLIVALLLNMRRGFVYVLLFILTLCLAAFPFLLVMKLIAPEHTGLFLSESRVVFGFIRNHDGLQELLGNWFIPVDVLLFTIFYFLIFLLLKQTKRKKR